MKKLRVLISIIIALIPFNFLRLFLYKFLLGFKVDKYSKISAFNLIVAEDVSLKMAVIGPFNIIKIKSIKMDCDSYIGKFNVFSKLNLINMQKNSCILHKNFIGGTYGTSVECGCENLFIGEGSQISLSCFFDLSNQIIIGNNVVIAGSGTQFWTHGFNSLRVRSTAPIVIKNNVFIGAASTVVQGIHICSDVVIGAGTVVHRNIDTPGLYVSNKLQRVG
jgi:acetyltransferase-like isoleucine patch superfamily enzyme